MNTPAPIRSLLIIFLSSLLMVGTPALAATDKAGDSQLRVSKTQPEDANDPLRLWFAEQDKLLDDILIRLSRIENLVRDIHQLVAQMSAGTSATPPTPQAPATVAPPTAPVVPALPAATPPVALPKPSLQLPPPKPGPTGIWGFFDEWGSTLAAIGLLALVLMIGQRHRKAKMVKSAAAPAAPAATDAVADLVLEPKPAAAVPPPTPPAPPVSPVTPAESKPAQEHSSIQRAGATEPSKGQADQALELADIMLSMGLGHGAAQTLTEQIRNEPKQALRHWLKLLEIYRKNGQQAEFEKSAEELRQHFNVQPEDWQVRPESLRSIEDYPHIATRMCELWGRPACLVYLQNLLADNRGGARSGFPQSVAEEFLLLTAMLKARGIAPEADAVVGS